MTAGIVSVWSPERTRTVHQERRAILVWRAALPMRPYPNRLSTSTLEARVACFQKVNTMGVNRLHQSPRSLHAAVHMPLPPVSDNLPHICRACTPL